MALGQANMKNLLTQLNWIEAPPAPPQQHADENYGGDDKWSRDIFNHIESLIWEIEVKGWRTHIRVERDVVKAKRLDHIPESFIRSTMDNIMAGDYPALKRLMAR